MQLRAMLLQGKAMAFEKVLEGRNVPENELTEGRQEGFRLKDAHIKAAHRRRDFLKSRHPLQYKEMPAQRLHKTKGRERLLFR